MDICSGLRSRRSALCPTCPVSILDFVRLVRRCLVPLPLGLSDNGSMQAIAFDHKLTVAVPSDFQRALAEAARLRGLSLPDLIRRELQGALVRERVPFRSFPDLERRRGEP